MRVYFTSLLVFTFLAYGCRDSKTPDTPAPTERVGELVKLLQSSDRQVAFDAATELGRMGSDAIAEIHALVDLETFDEKGSYIVHHTVAAGEALSKIDAKAAVPYLTKALQHPSKRYWAARVLGEFGDTAKPAIPALVDVLRAVTSAQTENERDASAQAAAALARIRPHGLSALISEMGHKDKGVRRLAVWATPRGPDGKPAVETLAWRLSDADPDIRWLAANALANIGSDASDALSFIKIALDKEPSGRVLFALQRAIGSIKEQSDDEQ